MLPGWVQVGVTVFYLLWLVAVLVLGMQGIAVASRQGKRLDGILAALTDMVRRAQDSTQVSAHAADQLAALVRDERSPDRPPNRRATTDEAKDAGPDAGPDDAPHEPPR